MICHSVPGAPTRGGLEVPRLNTTWRSTSCAMEVKKMSARVRISIMLRACFHSLEDNADNRIGQAGEVIVAITVAVGEDPRGYDLIHGAEEAMRRDGDGDFCPENAGLLAFAQNALDYVKIFHQQIVGELAKKFRAVPQLRLKNNGQAAVGTKRLQVQEG